MSYIFNSSNFNQDISSWCVTNITSEPEKFATNSPLLDINKPVWGTCPSGVCEISVSLTSGSSSQTVIAGSTIEDVQYTLSSSCSDTTYSVTASGLPAGVSLTTNNNTAIISGTPSTTAGTYTYSLTVADSQFIAQIQAQYAALGIPDSGIPPGVIPSFPDGIPSIADATAATAAVVSGTITVNAVIVDNTGSTDNSDVNFVGVGYKIITSSDGENWTERNNPSSEFLRSVIYANGLWVAVGNGATIITSSDGKNWTQQTSNISDALIRVFYAGGKFIASGHTGNGPSSPSSKIIVSDDAINWSSITASGSSYSGITYGNGLYVVAPWLETNGQASSFMTSTDAVNWSSHAHNLTNNGGQFNNNERLVEDIAFGNGIFVGTGINGRIIKSSDGKNWVPVTTNSINQSLGGNGASMYKMKFLNGNFIAVGGGMDINSLFLILTSTDGDNWIKQTNDLVNTQWARGFSVTYGNGKYIIIGNKSGNDPATVCLTSTDGVNWTTKIIASGTEFGAFGLASKN